MHGLTGGGWKRSDLATVTAVKRPAGETRGKLAGGPNARQRHRASPRPYIQVPHGPSGAPPGGPYATCGMTVRRSARERGAGIAAAFSASLRT